MKNKLLDYEYEELDEFIVPNYFSKNVIEITDALSELDTTYLTGYRLFDGDKLERVSYELYQTSDYWDVLLLLNNRDPLFGVPFGYDTTYDTAVKKINLYARFQYSNAPLVLSRYEALRDEIISDLDKENERFRDIIVVKPEYLTTVIDILTDKGYL